MLCGTSVVRGAGRGNRIITSSLCTPQLPKTDSQVAGARCSGRMLINIDHTFSESSQAPRQEAAVVLSLVKFTI